ncbi:MFS transporter [Brevibacillus daliensis]|uniref:MFS transporter n=1 Tax=Brevibacillus daliensis TaxID=2892995 RepID=UPI001E2F2A94|nr:MFS transporter [Brevibacillus daliensis]
MQTHLVRGYNLFYFSTLAIFISFLPVYLASQGFSNTTIGSLLAVGSFIGIISQPLWGIVSDKVKTIKKILVGLLFISLLVGTLLFQSSNMLSVSILVGLMYFFFMPTDPLTESLNFQTAEKRNISFGSIRMFGPIGYATSSLLVGIFAEKMGMDSIWILYLFFGAISILLVATLEDSSSTSKPISWQTLKQFLLYGPSLRFFLLVLLIAIPHRMNDSFLGIYIQSSGGSTGLIGQGWFVAAVSEIILFAFSHKFLKPGKEWTLISFAAVMYIIRYIASALAPSPEWIVVTQLLHGISFVIFYTASIQYLYTIIPEEWKATGQTVLAILFFGVSSIIGSILGGVVLDWGGGSALYFFMAGLSAVGLLYAVFSRKA